MRERHTVKKPIAFKPSMAERIQEEADKLGTSFADIVRDCVDHDWARLKERNRKRLSKQKK